MKVYTKTGDHGTTSLVGGTRISKSDIHLEVYGTIDELNSFIGLLITEKNIPFLTEIQRNLFYIGGIIATEKEVYHKYWGHVNMDLLVEKIEQDIDLMTEKLPEKSYFTLPQGSKAITYAHICRTVCRKAERKLVEFNKEDPYLQPCQKFVNRLSDYFYILARFFHLEDGIIETPCILSK